MPASQIFNVLTEFRFDIAHAVAGSKTMQSEIGKISSAADQAHFAIQRISAGLVAQTGLGTGGILGFLYKAVQISDKFYNAQLKLSNIMLSNKMFSGDTGFEQSMVAAEQALTRMSAVSRKFGLDGDTFASMATGIGAALSVKGLDDSTLSKSTDLTRSFMKSAPVLGIDPASYQQNLLDMVMGQGSTGDRMSQRLMAETTAMAPFKGSMKGFNALEPAKRLEVLTKALDQFSSNAKINEAVVNSLSGQMRMLTNSMTSIFSVFRSIGDAISKPLIKILKAINKYVQDNFEQLSKIVSRVLGDLIKDPEKLFVNIQQLRRLQSDVKKAGNLLALIGLVHSLTAALRYFGFTLGGGLIMTALRSIMGGMRYLGALLFNSGALMVVFRGLAFVATKVLAPLALLTMIFQSISRGMAKAEVINAKWIADNLVRITEAFENFKTQLTAIFAPFEMAIEGLSNIFAWIFRLDFSGGILLSAFEGLNKALEVMGRTIVGLLSIVAGFTNAVIGVLFDLKAGNFKAAYKNLIPNFKEGMTDLYRQYYKPPGSIDMSNQQTAQTKIEIDKIEINNAFKENAEPDRIAFTLKEQLMKAALNPTQSSGRSLSGAAIGN
jgi:hypothetical protein